jgi:electron transfer flavoprotein alpha subunit
VNTAGILVCSDSREVAGELLGEARRLAEDLGCEVMLCPLAEPAPFEGDEAVRAADIMYTGQVDFRDPTACVGLLVAAIEAARPRLVLVASTKLGMEVAPRAAERIAAPYAAWATGIRIDPGSDAITAQCLRYGGMAMADVGFTQGTVLLTAGTGVFEPASSAEARAPRTEPLTVEVEASGITVTGERAKPASGASLERARAVVDVGQGVRDSDDLTMVRDVAGVFQAEIGCSRPVSCDRNWLPDWIGLSGAKVKPDLCLTLGISGAIQHVVGIRESRVVAAVNMDKEAAVFTQADIGVVADLYEFIPTLLERLQERGARLAWA